MQPERCVTTAQEGEGLTQSSTGYNYTLLCSSCDKVAHQKGTNQLLQNCYHFHKELTGSTMPDVSTLEDKLGIIAKVREHFSKPDAQLAFVNFGDGTKTRCVYRGNEDPKSPIRCAFGVLLPDKDYNPNMEGMSIQQLAECVPAISAVCADIDWLLELQYVHDDVAQGLMGSDVANFLTELDLFEARTKAS